MFFFSALFGWIAFFYRWTVRSLIFASLFAVLSYAVPFFINTFKKPQDLKRKYDAKWAVVTGASSGIGRALTEKLAEQGINVVMVALDDKVFAATYDELTLKFPKVTLRKVGADLGRDGYMDLVQAATSDITPNLLFNNAGYITFGLFTELSLERQLANIEVNMLSGVKITHYIVRKMQAAKLRGAVCFTSSPANLIPAACTAMYGSTKAFVTQFAGALAGELAADKIDVLIMHPSPVATNFYAAPELLQNKPLQFFKGAAVTPAVIADCMLASVGDGFVIRDQGAVTFVLQLLVKLLDTNFFASLGAKMTPNTAEYKYLVSQKAAAQAKSE